LLAFLLLPPSVGGCVNGAALDPAPGGAAGATPGGAAGAPGSAGAAGVCVDGIPPDIETLLATRCLACHGVTPLANAPTSLATYADLVAPSRTDPTRSNAQLALARMQDPQMPMPPAPLSPPTPAEVAALSSWVQAGTPAAPCADGGAGSVVDPFAAAPTCTSGVTWTRGNRGSSAMNPGEACIACHAGGEGPYLSIAGTLYPSAHEPDLCDGFGGGAQVVIVGADGRQITLAPGTSGNFGYSGFVATPYKAKVIYMGRERAMIEPQTSGDCNACHTQAGVMNAPGRILVP
jgi:hypothetical protein